MRPNSIQTLSMEEVEFSVIPSKKKKGKMKYFIIGGLALCLLLFGGLMIGLLFASKRTPPVETIPSIPTIVEVEQNTQANQKKKRKMETPPQNRQEVIQKGKSERQSSIRPVFGLTHQEMLAQDVSEQAEVKETLDTTSQSKTIAEAR